ncbi:hypothetical protein N7527_008856 [Penicillium freii]|nr:hypothetical protein N7527_008856 [Penicillium freii]
MSFVIYKLFYFSRSLPTIFAIELFIRVYSIRLFTKFTISIPYYLASTNHYDLYHKKFIRNYDYLLDTEYSPDTLKRRREKKVKAKKTQ